MSYLCIENSFNEWASMAHCISNKVLKFIVQIQLLFNKLDKGGVEIVPLPFNLNISKPVSYENETLSL